MAQYTDSGLLAKLLNVIKANANQEITGPVLQDMLTDFVDSKANKNQVAPSNFPKLITPADLDAQHSIAINHNLNCLVPDVIMYAGGYKVERDSFDTYVVDANNATIIFPDAITVNHKCILKYTVDDVVEDAPANLEYETEDFNTWEGTDPNSAPAGWAVVTDTEPLDGSHHHVYNDNGVAAFYSNYTYVNADSPNIRLYHPKYLQAGQDYKVTVDVLASANQFLQISMGSAHLSLGVTNTYGVYRNYELPFTADANGQFWIGASIPGNGEVMDIRIDNLIIEKV